MSGKKTVTISEEVSLDVTEEIQDLFNEMFVCLENRDIVITKMFSTRKAIYYGKRAREKKLKAWSLIQSLYPEYDIHDMTYHADTAKLIIKK